MMQAPTTYTVYYVLLNADGAEAAHELQLQVVYRGGFVGPHAYVRGAAATVLSALREGGCLHGWRITRVDGEQRQ